VLEIIAEAGINHNGKLSQALKLVDAAHEADADVVKFQTFDPKKLLRPNDPSMGVLAECILSTYEYKFLAKYCEEVGIEFMSTPGDLDSLKFLVEELGVKRIKIGSDDLTNKELVESAYNTGLPVILSTGMATTIEIDLARQIYGKKTTLLHCVSTYPCAVSDANLRAISAMRARYHSCDIGYSDHCKGYLACLGAVALGAVMIEKHFRLRWEGYCPDYSVSIDEKELLNMVRDCRILEQMLGDGVKQPCEAEKRNIPLFRKGADGFRGQI